jgi:hypothetical protein
LQASRLVVGLVASDGRKERRKPEAALAEGKAAAKRTVVTAKQVVGLAVAERGAPRAVPNVYQRKTCAA